LLPGYTHLQIAMPSSFGLWFGAYAESLVDDMQLLLAAYRIANQNPLGSAAGYGSSFPINRQLTTDLLGFDSMNYNVVYAQMGRGKVERTVAFALSSLASTLSKMAVDVCLYVNQNFGFFKIPEAYTTGSSIMPHKKNPDVFELIRAKCNRIQSLPTEIAFIGNNLPSGYFRDLQIIKESFLPAFDELKNCLFMADMVMKELEVNKNILDDDRYKYLFSVEEVNKLVAEGIPFRDAYKKIAEAIQNGSYNPAMKVAHTHEGSMGNLCNDKIALRMERIMKEFNFQKTDKAVRALLKNGKK
jgi:argininosuccinate lyase